ncbi:MAG: hypothetical protein GF346_08715, partial [Candidatus Eisenbacteria bacterium]|nr:hypothetical protein [Candidatus Latescibacterota bacterium]MBD3302517.1 hypothetical protein [Candidatus Eisenbacteria bacterium]
MWFLVAAAVLASAEPPPRSALALPDSVWSEVRARIHAEDRPIGYTETEMRAYGRDLFLLPTVLRSFEDVRSLARDSGRITDELLEDSGADLAETARRAFLLLDVSAGRRTMPAQPESLLELPDDLPAPIRRLAGRLYAGAEAVSPWVRAAYDIDPEVTTAALYSTAVALRNDEQFDQLASLSRESLRLYRTTDLA